MLKLDYDVTAWTFRYVESLWFNYYVMISRMKDIELDSSISDDVNKDIRAKGLTSDPTAAAYFRIEYARQSRQYQTLEKNVKAIEEVFNSLPKEYKAVAESRYFAKHSKRWKKIAEETGYSERHARRIRDMIVVATAEKLGLW